MSLEIIYTKDIPHNRFPVIKNLFQFFLNDQPIRHPTDKTVTNGIINDIGHHYTAFNCFKMMLVMP